MILLLELTYVRPRGTTDEETVLERRRRLSSEDTCPDGLINTRRLAGLARRCRSSPLFFSAATRTDLWPYWLVPQSTMTTTGFSD